MEKNVALQHGAAIYVSGELAELFVSPVGACSWRRATRFMPSLYNLLWILFSLAPWALASTVWFPAFGGVMEEPTLGMPVYFDRSALRWRSCAARRRTRRRRACEQFAFHIRD